MRMATWNLERADPAGAPGRAQLDIIARVAADVWVFTKAHQQAVPTKVRIATSSTMLTPEPAWFSVIAAPGLTPVPLPEVQTGTAALVPGADCGWLVIGVCMPWHLGAPDLPADAAPGGRTGTEQWFTVLSWLADALDRLRAAMPTTPIMLAGDFNQTLSGRVVGSRAGQAQLEQLLASTG